MLCKTEPSKVPAVTSTTLYPIREGEGEGIGPKQDAFSQQLPLSLGTFSFSPSFLCQVAWHRDFQLFRCSHCSYTDWVVLSASLHVTVSLILFYQGEPWRFSYYTCCLLFDLR